MNKAMKSRTGAAAATTAKSEEQVLDLRRSGASYRQIAAMLQMSVGNAHKLVKRGLNRHLDKCSELANEIRTLELDRLDALQCSIWAQAEKGRVQAIDRVLKIMERRASLLGLDAPKRHAVAGDRDGPPIGHAHTRAHELTDDALAAIAAGGRA
jgi:hypothetical protein